MSCYCQIPSRRQNLYRRASLYQYLYVYLLSIHLYSLFPLHKHVYMYIYYMLCMNVLVPVCNLIYVRKSQHPRGCWCEFCFHVWWCQRTLGTSMNKGYRWLLFLLWLPGCPEGAAFPYCACPPGFCCLVAALKTMDSARHGLKSLQQWPK